MTEFIPESERPLAAEDLRGSVRQSLGDLARVSESLDGGAAPDLSTARLLETIARELRGAAAVCGGYASGFTA